MEDLPRARDDWPVLLSQAPPPGFSSHLPALVRSAPGAGRALAAVPLLSLLKLLGQSQLL